MDLPLPILPHSPTATNLYYNQFKTIKLITISLYNMNCLIIKQNIRENTKWVSLWNLVKSAKSQ
jgi:hypothetical protein